MQESEHDSIDACIERHREYLLLLARLQLNPRLQSKVDLSGVVQQTLLEAHLAKAQFSGLPAERRTAWLRAAMAHNLADEIRKARADKRDVARELSLEKSFDDSSQRLELWAQSAVPSPSAGVMQEERAVRLAEALQQLPAAQREALVLHYWQGLGLAEMAEQLGRSRAATAGLLKRGLQQLRMLFPGSFS